MGEEHRRRDRDTREGSLVEEEEQEEEEREGSQRASRLGACREGWEEGGVGSVLVIPRPSSRRSVLVILFAASEELMVFRTQFFSGGGFGGGAGGASPFGGGFGGRPSAMDTDSDEPSPFGARSSGRPKPPPQVTEISTSLARSRRATSARLEANPFLTAQSSRCLSHSRTFTRALRRSFASPRSAGTVPRKPKLSKSSSALAGKQERASSSLAPATKPPARPRYVLPRSPCAR